MAWYDWTTSRELAYICLGRVLEQQVYWRMAKRFSLRAVTSLKLALFSTTFVPTE